MRKIFIVILTVFLIITFVFFLQKNSYESYNKKLEDRIKVLESEILELGEKFDSINEEKDSLLNYTCEYVETYRYIDDYTYMGAVLEEKFIIVDKFQEFVPRIIRINTSNIKINFEKGKNYEFTFRSGLNDSEAADIYLVKVVETDKVGLEQNQEYCGIRTIISN